jgi:hypothetical protein
MAKDVFLITPFDHFIVGTSFIYCSYLHIFTIVWSLPLLFTVSDYIFSSLYET